ncbi:COG4315 family predicted lipoprotein [Microbacterium sp. XT11]|uniref:COG4315 family predicted lipoprotein n=1 Tax=Microbacterium sp. XT11 TaxID=367477 RepID=UPI000742DFFC|nr:hypothetical protein [Microbacterium sp. XT11]ALX66630.1 Secreted repeat of unknown function [Microbacterium sp. XT11]
MMFGDVSKTAPVAVLLALLALSGCSSTGDAGGRGGDGAYGQSPAPASGSPSPDGGSMDGSASLGVADSDGDKQITLNGWPLYYFAGDEKAGDVKGQGVNGVWWVLTPAGERHAD